jgi:DNA repair protein RadC
MSHFRAPILDKKGLICQITYLPLTNYNITTIILHMTTQDESLIDQLLHTQGTGQRLLNEWKDLPNLAQNLDAVQITATQRKTLAAAFQLRFVRDTQAMFVVNSPTDAADAVMYIGNEPQEVLVVLCLNSRNSIIHKELVYRGSVNASQVRIAELFRPAIVHRATAIIISHNHPSGDPTPSPDDVYLTKVVIDAGKLLDIHVLDHVVIGMEKYVSMKERGLAFA